MESYSWAGGETSAYIASRKNPRVMEAVRLLDKKKRSSAKRFLCEGVKLTREALAAGLVCELYIRESSASLMYDIMLDGTSAGAETFVLSDPAFEKISTESSPQGIISLCRMRETVSADDIVKNGKPILLLDSVRDPGNLGTVIRSAAALGGVTVAVYSCADIYGEKTVRASMGAVFKADIVSVDDANDFVAKLISAGRRVIAASPSGESMVLGRDGLKQSDCIVVGNEGHGVSERLLDACTSTLVIPICSDTESLNASAAAAVILWEWVREA